MNFNYNKTDIFFKNSFKLTNTCKTFEYKKNNYIYRLITFSNINNLIKNEIKKSIEYFLNIYHFNKNNHVFIVGIGNDNHTADSIGPKTLKHIIVNSHLKDLGIKVNHPLVSALEPGVLEETGIKTKKIIENITDEIKPNIIILIDSYVINKIEYLNKCIQITNEGITPGSGLHSLEDEISFKTIGIPIIVIGIPTTVEINYKNNNYFLSTKDIDIYVSKISKIIGESLNELFYQL